MIQYKIKPTKENLKELFKNPPGEYRVYPIMHNLCDPGREEQMDASLQAALESGAGGLVTNTTWEDIEWVYKKSNLELLEKAAAKAKAQGLHVWMYDDYWYPSGWANGYALKDHPEYGTQNITYLLQEGEGTQELAFTRQEDSWGFVYGAFYKVNAQGEADFSAPLPVKVSAEKAGGTAPGGKWLFLAFYIKRHFATEEEKAEAAKHPGGYREYLNFLDKRAVDRFLDCALTPVAEHFGEEFGQTFEAIFTDEPTLAGPYLTFARRRVDFKAIPAPYGPTLFEEFRQKWGYDLREKLPYLFVSETPEAKRVRLHYYRTVSDIALRDFTQNAAAWCAAHGTSASGHFLLEEGLNYHVGYYGDYMKVMSGQDYPGCDVLAADAQLFWEPHSGFHTSWLFAGKYPSSASRLKGHNTTMMEICPVNQPERFKENPFKEFMGLTTSVIFTGITHYNAYGYNYITDPAQHRQWNEYAGRLLTVLRNSVSDCGLGVYYPISAAQGNFTGQSLHVETAVDLIEEAHTLESNMEALCRGIYEGKLDFNILTEEALLAASVENGILQAGQLQMKVLLVPFAEFLPLSAAEKFEAFMRNGGKVYFIGCQPAYGLEEKEDAPLAQLREKWTADCRTIPLEELPALLGQLRQEVGEALEITGEGVFASRYRFDGQMLYYIINIKEQATEVSLGSESLKKMTLRDPMDGTAKELTLPCTIPLQGERGVLIFAE